MREEAWELRHRAAQRAVDLALVHQRIRAPNLVAAATQVVLAFLRRATGLNEVEERAEEGQRWLTSSSEDLSDRDDEDRSVTRFLSETERQLQWLVHLVNDPTVGSLVRLSSLLRNWAERSRRTFTGMPTRDGPGRPARRSERSSGAGNGDRLERCWKAGRDANRADPERPPLNCGFDGAPPGT